MHFSSKKRLLVISKILGLFVNTLTAYNKYCLLNRNNSLEHLQMQFSYLTKKKTFSQLFVAFWKSRFNFEYFQKTKMILIADVILNLGTSKNVVR